MQEVWKPWLYWYCAGLIPPKPLQFKCSQASIPVTSPVRSTAEHCGICSLGLQGYLRVTCSFCCLPSSTGTHCSPNKFFYKKKFSALKPNTFFLKPPASEMAALSCQSPLHTIKTSGHLLKYRAAETAAFYSHAALTNTHTQTHARTHTHTHTHDRNFRRPEHHPKSHWSPSGNI